MIRHRAELCLFLLNFLERNFPVGVEKILQYRGDVVRDELCVLINECVQVLIVDRVLDVPL